MGNVATLVTQILPSSSRVTTTVISTLVCEVVTGRVWRGLVITVVGLYSSGRWCMTGPSKNVHGRVSQECVGHSVRPGGGKVTPPVDSAPLCRRRTGDVNDESRTRHHSPRRVRVSSHREVVQVSSPNFWEGTCTDTHCDSRSVGSTVSPLDRPDPQFPLVTRLKSRESGKDPRGSPTPQVDNKGEGNRADSHPRPSDIFTPSVRHPTTPVVYKTFPSRLGILKSTSGPSAHVSEPESTL